MDFLFGIEPKLKTRCADWTVFPQFRQEPHDTHNTWPQHAPCQSSTVIIALVFSVIAYWLSAFYPTGNAFMMWVMWLFLDLVAAESLVVFVASIFPNFVIALALIAFANGLWMSVGGFLVTPTILNVFWKYVFSYIDYQKYVFQGMMVNQFQDSVYDCAAGCMCAYESALSSQCEIAGVGVLQYYGYSPGSVNEWISIMLAIIAGYRLLGWAVTWVKKT